MSFIGNLRGEKVLRHRFLKIASHDDTIQVKSEEGKAFPVSRFLFNFFSNFILPHDADVVLTPLSSDHLDSVIQNISSGGLQFEEHPFSDIVMDNFTISGNKTPRIKQLEEEYGLSDQSQSELSLSSTSFVAKGEAEILNTKIKGMAESLDIKSEKALVTVDRPSNIKTTPEKKDLKKAKQSKQTNHAIQRIRKKPGAHLVGSRKGNPKIEWDSMDGEKYVKTITCQVCGKLFDHKKYASKRNITDSYREHYKQHELETTDCCCDNIQFKSHLERKQHWKIVHKGHTFCKLCRQTFSSEAGYKLHIENAHQEKMCDQCNFRTSKGSYYLRLHIRKAHENIEESGTTYAYACNQGDCKRTFITQGRLNRHINKAHVLSTCNFCSKQVKKLYEHIKNMHAERKYQCDICAKAFQFPSKLVEHEKVEHQGLRYFCRYPDCKTKGQEYRDSSNRITHERKRHGAPYKSRQ